MKNCTVCETEKPLEMFYKHPRAQDGRANVCKDCHKARMEERRQEKLKDPEWAEKELARHREKARRYREQGKYQYRKEHNKSKSEWSARNPQKRKAHQEVSKAIRSGCLQPQDCKVCGSNNTHAHHEDYNKPLDVVWLCPKHHAARHVEINKMKRQKTRP